MNSGMGLENPAKAACHAGQLTKGKRRLAVGVIRRIYGGIISRVTGEERGTAAKVPGTTGMPCRTIDERKTPTGSRHNTKNLWRDYIPRN